MSAMGMTDSNRSADSRRSLSVVIVTHNEENRIRECIESVVSSCRGLVDFEIILVDSNSTDRTVDIAREYPITIFRIPDDELTTPGAGRYVGTQATNRELMLFVDGDMILQRRWLERALESIQQDGVAAVDGQLNSPAALGDVSEVDAVRGVALYKREPLLAVGGFDPHLQSLEDIHLGFELQAAGYTLCRLPEMAASHPPRQPISEPIRRWRCGYMTGIGQALRKSLWSPVLLIKHLSRMRYRIGLLVWLCFGLATLSVFSAFLLWVGLSFVAGAILVSKLGFKDGVSFLFGKLIGIVGLVWGLFTPFKPAESFPLQTVETLQRETTHHEPPPAILEDAKPRDTSE